MELGLEELTEGDCVLDSLFGQGSGRVVRVPEGVEDEGEASDMGGKLLIEAVELGGGRLLLIDVAVIPGAPDGEIGELTGDGETFRRSRERAEMGEEIDDGIESGCGGWGDGFAILRPVGGGGVRDDGEEALDEAVLVATLETGDNQWLDASGDADDRMLDEDGTGGFARRGERLMGPEGEVFLAVVATARAVLIHGADDGDEFVADNGETGSMLKIDRQGFGGDVGGVEAIEGDGVRRFCGGRVRHAANTRFVALRTPTQIVGCEMGLGGFPGGDGAMLKDVQWAAGGFECGSLAGTGGGDGGDPEDGTFLPAGGDGETKLTTDDGTSEGKQGCGDHLVRRAGGESEFLDVGGDIWREYVQRELR